MALAEVQHEYYTGVDFDTLAKVDDAFGSMYRKNGKLDWQDPHTIQILTKALLKRDFNLTLSLPDDRLCPPVPVRWNYIRWMQQLIDTTSEDYSDLYHEEREITGLDIGVGASCIYSLLACASRPNWRMLGTDIDSHSLEYARKNVTDNDLQHRILLQQTTREGPLLPLDAAGIKSIHFSMCNPPFYASEEDMNSAYGGKALPPSAVCTGSVSEMICPGGDLGFATRILEESLQLKDRVQWYSCMFGRLASAQQLVTRLKAHGITNYAASNLRAGQKTVRWAVAWSLNDYRPRNDIARHGSLTGALLAPATERTIEVSKMSAAAIYERLHEVLSPLDLEWKLITPDTGIATASGNVWSRSARRKKMNENAMQEDSSRQVELVVKIVCQDQQIQVRWLRGHNTILLESFIGMLKVAFGLRNGMAYDKA